jgi:antibiotic biosynthesis monooxygenase (ABM) superfamily enzyme
MEIAPKPGSPVAAPASPPRPIRWRQALLTALAVYPFITGYIMVLFPLTEGWAIWQRTALLVPLMVTTIVYVIAPQLQRRFGGFIMGAARR